MGCDRRQASTHHGGCHGEKRPARLAAISGPRGLRALKVVKAAGIYAD